MSKHASSIKVPVLLLSVSGEYSRFKKPTGLENLILTAIGTDTLSNDTWREFISRLSIPTTMEPLFAEVMKDLYDNGVISDDRFDLDNDISCTGFTQTGLDLFEKGRIKQKPKTFRTSIYYHPSANPSDDRYLFTLQTSASDDFNAERFESISYDEDELRKFLVKNKKEIGADREDEILTMNVDFDPSLQCIKRDVSLSFDEVSGDFAFDSYLDSNFIKRYYSVSELLSTKIDMFKFRDMGLTSMKIPADWTSYRYHLPCDFEFRGKLRVYDPSCCSIPYAYPCNKLGFSFVEIIGSEVGRGYVSVKKDIRALGVDGAENHDVLISRTLTKDEIRSIMDKVSSDLDISDTNELIKFLELSENLLSRDSRNALLRRHLDAAKDPSQSVLSLKKTKKPWVSELADVIESAVFDSKKDLKESVETIKRSEMKVRCESLAKKFDKGDAESNLAVADALFTISSAPRIVSAVLGIDSILGDYIIKGRQEKFVSKELLAANTATVSLGKLRECFNIESPKKYDLTVFDDSKLAVMKDSYSTFVKSMDIVRPLIDDSKDSELSEYVELFQNLNEIYGKDVPLESLNGYLFGIGARRKLEGTLRKVLGRTENLASLIRIALESHIVTEEEYQILLKIKEYGNDCAHPKNESAVPPINAGEKKSWIHMINDVSKRTVSSANTKNKKKK